MAINTYIKIPSSVSYREIVSNNKLSAIGFKKIIAKNNSLKKIKDLITENPTTGKEVGSNAYVTFETNFKFIRTKAIQEQNFQLDLNIEGSFEYIKPFDFKKNKGRKNKNVVDEGDLLFVTGGNVGEVVIAQDVENGILSSHIIKLPVINNKYYVFAFLKNPFCKEQANFGPIGSIAGLDTFNKNTLLNIKIPFPTQKNKDEIITYVELLTKAIIDKEKKIRNKHQQILQKIEKELLDNQKDNKFEYVEPTFNEIKINGRLDTAMYGKKYKYTKFLIENYKFGCSTLKELKYTIVRGQNLQISQIGRSIYSNTFKKIFYKLLLSKHFTEQMTCEKELYVGNPNKLKTIQKGDIIFSCRGNLGRTIVFCDEINNTITNIDNVHIKNKVVRLENKIFIGCFLSYLRQKRFLTLISITGSGADSFTKYHFALLKFPNFPEQKQKEIASLYHNPVEYPKSLNLKNFLEEDTKWNEKAGIIEIDKSMKQIKEYLNNILDKIVNDEKVDINFSF